MEERMEYIVLDLEWNQSNTGKEDAVEKLPFEIIEIGAIKLNKERVMVSEFNELIKPQVYHEMHKITSKLIHIQMQELERGRPFPEVGGDFVRWCGQEEYLFCTWGTLDRSYSGIWHIMRCRFWHRDRYPIWMCRSCSPLPMRSARSAEIWNMPLITCILRRIFPSTGRSVMPTIRQRS